MGFNSGFKGLNQKQRDYLGILDIEESIKILSRV